VCSTPQKTFFVVQFPVQELLIVPDWENGKSYRFDQALRFTYLTKRDEFQLTSYAIEIHADTFQPVPGSELAWNSSHVLQLGRCYLLKRDSINPREFPTPEHDPQTIHGAVLEGKEICIVLIDNSNIFIEGQKCWADKELEGVAQDPRARVDYGQLVDTLVGENRVLALVRMYGSVPPAIDTVWTKMRDSMVSLRLYEKVNGKEKEVDTALAVDATTFLYKPERAHSALTNVGTYTIIALVGDLDFRPAVFEAVEGGGGDQPRFEIWSWARGLSRELRDLGDRHPQRVRVHTLDDRYRDFCYVISTWDFKKKGSEFPRDRTVVFVDQTSENVEEIAKTLKIPYYIHSDLDPERPGERVSGLSATVHTCHTTMIDNDVLYALDIRRRIPDFDKVSEGRDRREKNGSACGEKGHQGRDPHRLPTEGGGCTP
jgi:hypothetical protein